MEMKQNKAKNGMEIMHENSATLWTEGLGRG